MTNANGDDDENILNVNIDNNDSKSKNNDKNDKIDTNLPYTAETDVNIRKEWVTGDWVEVYSKSRDQWFCGKIIEIYEDDDGEWLVVVYNNFIKEVQRFEPNVRPLIDNLIDQHESTFSDTDSQPDINDNLDTDSHSEECETKNDDDDDDSMAPSTEQFNNSSNIQMFIIKQVYYKGHYHKRLQCVDFNQGKFRNISTTRIDRKHLQTSICSIDLVVSGFTRQSTAHDMPNDIVSIICGCLDNGWHRNFPFEINIDVENSNYVDPLVDCGVCYVPNYANGYDVIFTVAQSRKVSMVLLSANDGCKGYELALPSLPSLPHDEIVLSSSKNSTVYSNKHGLITICDRIDKMYVLAEFDSNCWESIDIPPTSTLSKGICTLINDDELFVCSSPDVAIYNFIDKKWKTLQCKNMDAYRPQLGFGSRHIGTSRCAVFYDAMKKRVFVGGGHVEPRAVSYYDIVQKKWVDLPNTNHKHGNMCVIWSTNNVVYIGGDYEYDLGFVECIDLGFVGHKERKWKVMPTEMQLSAYVDPLFNSDSSDDEDDDEDNEHAYDSFCIDEIFC